MVREPLAEQAEQFFKKKGGGDDRGTGVMPEATAFKHLSPAADRLAAVYECDVVALGFLSQRCCDPTKTCANNDSVLPLAALVFARMRC